jgi:hypothetical protein
MLLRAIQHAADERRKDAGLEVALANLNQVDTGCDRLVELRFEKLESFALGPRPGRQPVPIGDEAQGRPSKTDHGAAIFSPVPSEVRVMNAPAMSRTPAAAVIKPMPVTAPRTN